MRRTILLVLCAALAAGAAAAEAPTPLARVEAAAAQHPDDPDLLWMLATLLLEQGEPARAADAFARFEERWPERRADAALQRGRALYEAGRPAEAERVLRRAVARAPADAAARLYSGLTLRDLGRPDEAERWLRFAAELDPALEGETLVLRGLSRLERGEREAARRLFRQAIERDPGSEAARRAERLLGSESPHAAERRLSLSAQGGFEYDSNVTLDSGTELPDASSAQRDTRLLFGGALRWRAWSNETSAFDVGYRFDETRHDALDEFDLQSHVLHASGTWGPAEHLALRLDAYGSATQLDRARYLRSAGLQPSLFLALGPSAGVLRLFAEGERNSYAEEASLDSLGRSGWALGGGAEHFVSFAGKESLWSSIGLRFLRTDTEASRDLFGFGPAFDHQLWEGTLRLHAPLIWRSEGDLRLGLGYERYAHRNVIDFLTDEGVGTLDPDRRRDVVFDLRLALSRPLTKFVDLELAWRRVERGSNVDVYLYDRDILGMYLRLHTP